MSESPVVSPETVPEQPRRRGIWWGEVVGGFLIAAMVVVTLGALVVWVYTGTDWGRERIRRYAQDFLQKEARGGRVRIGRISGNLLTGMTVHDIVITDTAGMPFVAVKRATGDYGIGDLINKRVWVNNIVLEQPLIVLSRSPLTTWNWKEIFPRDTTPKPASEQTGWMDRLRFTNATIVDGTLIVRTPWTPSRKLSGVSADSAVREALKGSSRLVIEKVPGGYQKIAELKSVNAFLPLLRLSEPGFEERIADVGSLSMKAYPFRPPGAEVTAFRGVLRFTNDSAWWRRVNVRLPNTVASGDGSYHFDSGDLTIVARGNPVDFADLRWVYPRMPSNARGKVDFSLKWREGMEEYVARNANVTVGNARVLGSLGVTLTDTVWIHDTDLRFTQVSTVLLEQIVEGFESPRRGLLSGRVKIDGGRNAMRVDGDVTFADSRAGTSRVIAAGGIGLFDGGLRMRDLRVRLSPFQVELARAYAPDLPISGIVTGTATLNGSTNGEMRVVADIDHVDRGARSLVSGTAVVSLAGVKRFDIDALAKPVSLVELGRFMPSAGLRGVASGPISAKGTLSNLVVRADLAVSGGGHVEGRATLDLRGAKRYDVAATMRALNLAAVTSKAPATMLTGRATIIGTGTELATMRTAIAADMTESQWDSVGVDRASVRATISGGLAQIERLNVAARNAVANASGSFGLTRNRSGTLRYTVAVDSLGAFNRWIPGFASDTAVVRPRPALVARAIQIARSDSARRARDTEVERIVTGKAPPKLDVKMPPALRRDTVGGTAYASGVVSGNIHDFDLRGRAGGENVAIRGNFVSRFQSEYAWTDARTANAKLAVGLDARGVMVKGFALDSVRTRVSYVKPGGQVELAVYQDDDRDYAVSAAYALSTARNELRLANLRMRFDTSLWTSPRPSTIHWGGPGIRVADFELRNSTNGRVYANGLLPTEGVANFTLAVDNFPVGDVVGLLQSDLGLMGNVDVSGSMSGTLREPTFRGAFAIVDGEYQGTTLPDLRGRFGYSDRQLVTQIEALRDGGQPMATVDGRLPINLAFTGVTGSRILDAPMSVDLVGDSLPVELIPHFTDAVSDLQGQVAGRISLRGRLDRPSLTGGLYIANTSMTVNATGMHVNNVHGVVRMANDVVTFGTDEAPITGDARGPVSLRGTINVGDWREPTFELYVFGEHAEVLDNKYGKVRADLGLALKGPVKAPYLSGQVTITDGVIQAPEPTGKNVIGAGDPALFNVLDTAMVTERDLFPAESPLLANMRVEVTLEVRHDTWVRNQDANVEIYTDYPLRINVANRQLNLTGVVSTDRGDYTFLSKRFQITRGSAMFIGSREINPTLQVTGEYRVAEGAGTALDVKVMIGGTLKRPRLSLESDAQPPRSQSELISLLAFGQPTTSLGSIQASSLSGSAGNTLTAGARFATRQLGAIALGVGIDQIEASFGKALATDYFNITPADVPIERMAGGSGVGTFLQDTRFEGGKYLNPRTFVVGQMVGFDIPGARLQYRDHKGWRYEVSAERRFLLKQPTLSDQSFEKRQAFGAFII
ncbi:MAG TPA: translocation/assembly module TamB domain-containing protein, partial [Gemmatimonadaceae bacterium]|nr:translocation/assembly module TamB domain-containing protein [Gemmatimonadaceae bacterium]